MEHFELPDPIYDGLMSARAACSIYDASPAQVFGLHERPPAARVPAHGAVLPDGAVVAEWLVYPATFEAQYEAVTSLANRRHWPKHQAALQTTALLANGVEQVLDAALIEKMHINTAKAMLLATKLHGDPGRAPDVSKEGDAVYTPIYVSSEHGAIQFLAGTLGELERACYPGRGLETMYAVMCLAIVGYELATLDSATGWAIYNTVVPRIQKAGKAFLKSVRSAEFHLQSKFAADTPIAVLVGQLNDLNEAGVKAARAQAAAARKKK